MQTLVIGHDYHRASHYPPIWIFSDQGKEIFQQLNSDPTVAVGSIWFSDVDYEGTLIVENEKDDDWVGVVFSFQVKTFLHFYIRIRTF